MVDIILMARGKLYHSNQDEDELVIYTSDQVFSKIKIRKVFKNSNILISHTDFLTEMFFPKIILVLR